MRILHCPSDVGAHGWALSRAERQLGFESDCMVLHQHGTGFPADVDLLWEQQRRGRFARLGRFVAHAIRHYDVFHFNFGSSLVHFPARGVRHWDLPLLKRLGKRIIVTYQGCDSRDGEYGRQHYALSACDGCDFGMTCCSGPDPVKAANVATAARYADAVFGLNPDLLNTLPRGEFLPYATIPLDDWMRPRPPREPGPWRILHAPSQRTIKGTPHVFAAVEALQAEGLEVELLLVEGLTRAEARKLYERADIAVDQLRVGWYGALAVETMALGLPTVCYLRDEDLHWLPPEMRADLPIISATPTSLTDVLRALIGRPESWPAIAERGRRYVQRWHDPLRIAERLIPFYQGQTQQQRDSRSQVPCG